MPKNKPPLKRNDELILNITAMGAEGQGIGRAEGFQIPVEDLDGRRWKRVIHTGSRGEGLRW